MDKTVLVAGVDFEKGAAILRMLDDAGLKISVALWVYLPEYEDWRMVLSSRKFDSVSLPKAYGLLHDALDAAGLSLEKTPPVMIMALSDPFIRSLRRIFGKAKSVDGMRFGGQTIGDRFVDDAYVYRIS
jgi:hypothetical protein